MTRTLDFGEPNPFVGIFGRPRHLAWPVNAYRITIPETAGRDDGLNPLERLVIGLLRADPGMSIDHLAETSCIPADLVRSILLRLRDKGLIDRDNRPASPSVIVSEPHAVTAMVFQDAIDGQILPYIHPLERDQLRQKELERNVRAIRADSSPLKHVAPDANSVVTALRQQRQRAGSRGSTFRLPVSSQIRVSPEAEQYFLDATIAIQRSDADYRIADPFGDGFSLALEAAFAGLLERNEHLQRWMTKWRTSLTADTPESGQHSRTSEPYEAAPIRRRYPRLVDSLIPGRRLGVRTTEKIYAAMEWALFYTADARNAHVAVEVLRQTPAADWSGTLTAAAEKVGLDVPKYGFRAVPAGRLKDFLEGKAEMATVTAINLMQAAIDTEHPLRGVAARCPDFLLQVQEIKEIRDGHAHGDAGRSATGESRFEPFLKECVSILIPEVRFSDSPPAARSTSSLDESLLEARTALIGAIGYKALNQLSNAARDALLDAEQHWFSHTDDDDALPLITSLNAALQAVTRGLLAGAMAPGLTEHEYVNAAASRSLAAGLGDLPATIATTRPERVREALYGNGSTLGACVVAFLVSAPPESLHNLGADHPRLLQDVGEVLASRRGHGNEANPLTKSEAGRLRKATLNSIQALLEV